MKTVIEMAREAGWKDLRDYDSQMQHDFFMGNTDSLKRLVDLARADAIAAEREACAKVCDWYVDYSSNPMNFAENCAQEIRARGSNT
jgi:hypothetical protein